MRILNRKNVRKSPSERTWRDVVVGGGFQIEESTKMSQSRSKWNIKRLEKIGQNKRERVQFINYSSLRTMSKVSWYSSVLYLSYLSYLYAYLYYIPGFILQIFIFTKKRTLVVCFR